MKFWRKTSLVALAKPFNLSELRKRVKIVVIDDDPNAFPVQALADEGYTIEHWPEVRSLARLEQGDFDIIILDIGGVADKLMTDGLEVLEHLKKYNPSQIVVAFSGQSFDLSKQRFFKLADDALQKPVSTVKCRQVLDQLIETKFTVEHMWATIVDVLQKENVSRKAIARIEDQVATAIRNGSKPDFQRLLSASVEKADLAASVAGVLVKIAALCGVSA